MADVAAPEAPMEVEPKAGVAEAEIPAEDSNNGAEKRSREEQEQEEAEHREKRSKTEEEKKSVEVVIGPKTFGTSVEMFDYFYKLLHSWTPNLNVNKVMAGL